MSESTPSQSTAANPSYPNPYVGPVPFEAKDRQYFFGREQEIAILRGLVLASRTMLFYAQSGAGKSSLLHAGVIPELTQQRTIGSGTRERRFQPMQVLPIVRVSPLTTNEPSPRVENPFVFHCLIRLLPHLTTDEIATMSLSEGLRNYRSDEAGAALDSSILPAFALPETERANATLLIFDQFEELFTTYPEHWKARRNLIEQLSEALQDFPFLHVLFVMREDYLAEITPYAQLLPERLQHRYRMERMKRASALVAIRQPALQAGRTYAEGVAESLADNLSRVQVVSHAQLNAAENDLVETRYVVGDTIEPVHLQIVCRQLWEKLALEQREIQQGDLQQLGNVDQALTTFYEDTLRQTAEKYQIGERTLRDWFEQKLITSARTRGILYCDQASGMTEELRNEIVYDLINRYLIRSNERGGDTWIELAHDRLIEPILTANQRWYEALNNPITAALKRWQQHNSGDEFLLQDAALDAARNFANTHPLDLSSVESEFLEASNKYAQQQAEARSRQRKFLWGGAIGLLVFSLAMLWAYLSFVQARDATDRRLALQRANAARQLSEQGKNEVATLLAIESNQTSGTAEGLQVLRNILDYPVRSVYLYEGHKDSVNVVRWSPKGRQLVSLSNDGSAQIWQPFAPLSSTREFSYTDRLLDAQWSVDESRLLLRSRSKDLLIWDFDQSAEPRFLVRADKQILGNALSPDGKMVAIWKSDGSVELHNADGSESSKMSFKVYSNTINSAVWNSDGSQLLLSGSDEETTTMIRTLTPRSNLINTIAALSGAVGSAMWNSDGSQIARYTASDDSTQIWDQVDQQLIYELPGGKQNEMTETHSVMGDNFGTLYYYDLLNYSHDRGMGRFILDSKLAVRKLKINESGHQILVIGENRNNASQSVVKLWQPLSDPSIIILADSNAEDAIRDISWQPGGTMFALASADHTVRLYDTTSRYELPLILRSGYANVATLHKDGQQLLTAIGADVDLVELSTGERVTSLHHDGTILSAKPSQDGTMLLTASEDGTARIWNIAADNEVQRLGDGATRIPYAWWWRDNQHVRLGYENPEQQIYEMQFWQITPTVTMMFSLTHTDTIKELWTNSSVTQMSTSSDDGTIGIWDAIDGHQIVTMTHNSGLTETFGIAVQQAVWIHNDRHLLSWSADGSARIWDATTWQPLITMTHGAGVTALNWQDEGRLVSGNATGVVRIWNAETGAIIYTLSGHQGRIGNIVWNRNKTRLLTAGEDGSIRMWNARNGKQILLILAHNGAINSILWNQQEDQILTASADEAVTIWNADTGERMMTLGPFGAMVLGAAWTPDETKVFVRTANGQVRLFYTDPQEVLGFACERAVRNMTAIEWARYMGDTPYHLTCPNLEKK